ncbi:DUF4349 domain-containing protein [Chloroflexota bacterium]
MIKKIMAAVLLVVVALTAVACAGTSQSEEATNGKATPPMPTVIPAPAPAPPMPPSSEISEEYYGGDSGSPGVNGNRMIVATGEINLVVDNVITAREQIAQFTEEIGGYVVSTWLSGEQQNTRGGISIRVPYDRYNEAFAKLADLSVRVQYENTSTSDVTEQYTDLAARLKNAQAAEKQYEALLEKAENVDETLRVYDSLKRIRTEIDQIDGQMQYLERTAAMSLINVSLEPSATSGNLVKPGWDAVEVSKSALRGLVALGKGLANAGIWLLIFSPLWGGVLAVIYWIYRRRQK